MKKTLFLHPVLTLAMLAAALVGCQLTDAPAGEEQVDAEAVAWAITDPGSGLTQEMTDLGSYLFGVDASMPSVASEDSAGETKALGCTASYALYCSGAVGGFTTNAGLPAGAAASLAMTRSARSTSVVSSSDG